MERANTSDQSNIGVSATGAMIAKGGELNCPITHPKWGGTTEYRLLVAEMPTPKVQNCAHAAYQRYAVIPYLPNQWGTLLQPMKHPFTC